MYYELFSGSMSCTYNVHCTCTIFTCLRNIYIKDDIRAYWACYVMNETWAYFDVSIHLLLYHYFLPVHVTNESFVITAEFPDSKDIFVTWNKRHTISSSCLYIVVSCAITKLPVTDSLLTLLWPYLCCWGRRQKRIKAFISSLSRLSHDPQVLLRRNALAFQRRAAVFARPRGGRSFLCPNASLRVSRRITLSWARFSVRIVQKNFGNSFRLASCGSSMWPEKLVSQCQGDNGTHCCSPHIFPTLGAAGNYRGERERDCSQTLPAFLLPPPSGLPEASSILHSNEDGGMGHTCGARLSWGDGYLGLCGS